MVSLPIANTEVPKSYFDKHPFPGLSLGHITTIHEYIFMLEKNLLYRAIKSLVKSGDRLLDTGCGTGEFTTYLAIHSGAEVIGLDCSEETLEWAKGVKRRIYDKPELSFCHGDVFKVKPSDHGMFDIILAMGLFTSIPDEHTALRNLVKVLKPGGMVVFGFFDPVARVVMRVERMLLHTLYSDFAKREPICRKFLLKHLSNTNELIWHINQLTEEFLKYHSPRVAISMMEECGLTITDCYPRLKAFGEVIPEKLNVDGAYKVPAVQLFGQLNWLRSGTDGYYVLIARKE